MSASLASATPVDDMEARIQLVMDGSAPSARYGEAAVSPEESPGLTMRQMLNTEQPLLRGQQPQTEDGEIEWERILPNIPKDMTPILEDSLDKCLNALKQLRHDIQVRKEQNAIKREPAPLESYIASDVGVPLDVDSSASQSSRLYVPNDDIGQDSPSQFPVMLPSVAEEAFVDVTRPPLTGYAQTNGISYPPALCQEADREREFISPWNAVNPSSVVAKGASNGFHVAPSSSSGGSCTLPQSVANSHGFPPPAEAAASLFQHTHKAPVAFPTVGAVPTVGAPTVVRFASPRITAPPGGASPNPVSLQPSAAPCMESPPALRVVRGASPSGAPAVSRYTMSASPRMPPKQHDSSPQLSRPNAMGWNSTSCSSPPVATMAATQSGRASPVFIPRYASSASLTLPIMPQSPQRAASLERLPTSYGVASVVAQPLLQADGVQSSPLPGAREWPFGLGAHTSLLSARISDQISADATLRVPPCLPMQHARTCVPPPSARKSSYTVMQTSEQNSIPPEEIRQPSVPRFVPRQRASADPAIPAGSPRAVSTFVSRAALQTPGSLSMPAFPAQQVSMAGSMSMPPGTARRVSAPSANAHPAAQSPRPVSVPAATPRQISAVLPPSAIGRQASLAPAGAGRASPRQTTGTQVGAGRASPQQTSGAQIPMRFVSPRQMASPRVEPRMASQPVLPSSRQSMTRSTSAWQLAGVQASSGQRSPIASRAGSRNDR